MWEIAAVTLCLGLPVDAEMSNCATFKDSWGPYETEESCDARLLEIRETWPTVLSLNTGYFGPVIMFGDKCTQKGEVL